MPSATEAPATNADATQAPSGTNAAHPNQPDTRAAEEAADRKAFELATKPGAGTNPKTHPETQAADPKDDGVEAADAEEGNNENSEGASAPEGKEPGAQPKKGPEKKTAEDLATPAQREKHIDAVRALRRDGWSEEAIKDLSHSRLLEIGGIRAGLQAKLDARFAQLKGSQPEGNTREPLADDRARTHRADAEAEASPGATDLDQLLDEIADPDQSEKVKVKVTAAEQRAAQAEARLLAVNLQAATKALADEFPKLADKSEWSRVLQRMDKLDPRSTSAGDPEAVQQLMRDACYIVFGPEITGKAQARKNLTDITNRHLDGQPDTGSSNSAPKQRLSPDEIDRAAFEASMGRTREESAAEYKRRTGQRT